jgi:hypothetical protein
MKNLQLKTRFSVKKNENLRETIFEKKRKRKREKTLNFYKKGEMKDQTLFFNPAKITRARERATALKETESQQKRTAADRRM